MRRSIGAACESWSGGVVDTEKSGLLAVLIHLVDEVEEVRFRTAKRIVEFVAIQDAHGQPPIGKCAPAIAPTTTLDFAGAFRKPLCWPRPRVAFRPAGISDPA